jgi:hypothetical protein
MSGVASTLYADFGATGFYKYDVSGWLRITKNDSEDMVAAELQ